jgi:hypothetical protein
VLKMGFACGAEAEGASKKTKQRQRRIYTQAT